MPFPTEWSLTPLHGAENIRFGMTFDEVVAILGAPEQPLATQWGSNAQRAAWAGGGVAIHFNPNVEFIEFSRDCGVRPHLGDLAPLDLPASEVVQRMATAGHAVDEEDPELGHTYVYKESQVAFWRHAVPESDDDEDGRFFDTVAIGRSGYYA